MTKVYVVTAGGYSDYHICAVYDSKGAAEYHRDFLETESSSYPPRIEEYELNPHRQVIAEGLKPYHVEMGRDGTTYGIETCPLCRALGSGSHLASSQRIFEQAYPGTSFCDSGQEATAARQLLPVTGNFYVLARDPEHAVKIVNEMRTRLIAENRWPTDPPRRPSGGVWFVLEPEPEGVCDDYY